MLHPRAKDLSGQRFGRLVALEPTADRCRGQIVWKFRCDCGVEVLRPANTAVRGSTTSCGCVRREVKASFMATNAPAFNKARSTHGHSRAEAGQPTPTYRVWTSMVQRCLNPKHKSFSRYGGRGIKVCDRWLDSFENFLADIGEKPSSSMEIDRIDNDGHYEPGNCRWATRAQNANNRAVCHAITFDGRTQNIKQWAAEIGTSHQTIANRLRKGWAVGEALTRPVNYGNGWLRGSR